MPPVGSRTRVDGSATTECVAELMGQEVVRRKFGRLLLPPPSMLGWANQRNGLAFVAPVNTEVFPVGREYRMVRIQFAHANQAQVGQVGFSVRITPRHC